MTGSNEADEGVLGNGTLARVLLGRFENLVAPSVLDPDERRTQAKAIGGLVAAGLIAALLSPFASLAELGMRGVVAPTILAGTCLALAALLASSGRLGLVLSLSIAGFAALVGGAAGLGAGLASPLLWLLLLAPVESLVAGRRTLAGFAGGMGFLALGGVALAEWAGIAGAGFGAEVPVTIALGLLFAALQTLRLSRARAAARQARALESAETLLIENALSDAVLRFSPDGRLQSASKAATSLFETQKGPLDDAAIFHAIHVTDRVRYLKAFGDIKSGAETVCIELRMQLSGDRGFSDIVMKLIPLRAAGALHAVLCLARDVTAERLRTAELSLSLAEVKKSSEAKSQFLASVSHELRTPLNAIIGFSDVLDQEFFGGFEDPRQKEYVGLIRQSGEHLLSVVNSLLDISKIEAGRYELLHEPFAIEAALRAAAGVIRPEAERKGLRFDLRLGNLRADSGPAEMVAGPRACHQILLNLLSNAVKFTDKGGITLEAERRDGTLVVRVSDTGIGIAASDIPRLGQPFTQASTGPARRYQGTGLGLSLVKALSELHQGSMEIASELGRGTTMTVRIPLDCPARIAEQQFSNDKIVALTDARKKTPSPAQDNRQARRSA